MGLVTGSVGGVGFGTLAAAGAVGGAVGSIAGQMVGIGLGVQDSFSWKGVLQGALQGGVAAGLGNFLQGSSSLLAGKDPLMVASRMAVTNVAGQGLGIATGLQQQFDWKGVAASAAAGYVSAWVGQSLPNGFGRNVATSLASGFVSSAVRGGSLSKALPGILADAVGATVGNALGDSIAAANGQQSTSDAGQREDRLGDFISQNQGAWDQRYANYQQVVGAFGQATASPAVRVNDVQLAAGPSYSGMGRVQDNGGYDFERSFRRGEETVVEASRTPFGDVRETVLVPGSYESYQPTTPFFSIDAAAAQEATSANSGTGVGQSLVDVLRPRDTLGTLLNADSSAPYNSNWQEDIVRGTLSNAIAQQTARNTPHLRGWDPQVDGVREANNGALLTYLNGQGSQGLGAVGASITMLASGNIRAASRVTEIAAPIDSLVVPMRGTGRVVAASGQRRAGGPGLIPNAALETERVLQGDASRARIVGEIGKAAQPSIDALLRLDPNARVGFRGSLASGLKGEHKIDANGNRVAFDGEVVFKKNQTGRYEPYAGRQGYDADFFVVSDKLAAQLGNSRRFMDAARLDGGSLVPVFEAFGRSLQSNPVLSGMKPGETTFRVWSQDAIARKLQTSDAQIYFLPGDQR
jgi:hypothetical protein